MLRSHQPYGFLQPPPRAIARHGVAERLAGGEAEARRRHWAFAWRLPLPCLQHERGGGKARALPHMQELSPGLEASDCRHLEQADNAAAALSRKALTPLGPAPRQHLATAFGRHSRAKAVPPLADEPRWLIGALHAEISGIGKVSALIGGVPVLVNWRPSQGATRHHDSETACIGERPAAFMKAI